ncbi:glycosyltransferase family 4 protein [Oricola indica]|uniref:glycosyltransferase family 4 protein n=1 Tax=Oricola indica TaxID=2872591 RepID=UPI001CBC7FE3|nr:glycosyltransferase family 4 protein [Oricola indica]
MRSTEDRVVVVHNGRRDNYQVAKALSEAGRDTHLVTDFYYQPDHSFGFLSKLVFGNSVWKRHEPGLSVVVHSSLGLLIADYLERFYPRNKIVNRMRGYLLGRLASKVIKRTGARKALFYYNCGLAHLPASIKRDCAITLFQMHPHPQSIRGIYESYLEIRPALTEELCSQEEEMTENTEYLKGLREEVIRSDEVICSSTFVKQSLVSAGVNSARIHLVPYGFPEVSDAVQERAADRDSDFALRLAFVGQFVVRKGVFELVAMTASRPDIELTVYTREAAFARGAIEHWLGGLPANITVKTLLDDRTLWADARQKDFLVLPSLVEGFGLVITEAMANGLAAICSKNTVGFDLIEDGRSGFLIDGYFAQDIEKTCDRAIDSLDAWPMIRANAENVARSRSWAAFREDISKIF